MICHRRVFLPAVASCAGLFLAAACGGQQTAMESDTTLALDITEDELAELAVLEADPTQLDLDQIVLTQIAADAWIHTSYQDLPEWGVFPSNGLVVVNGDAIVVVDTAWGVGPTESLLREIEERFGRLPTAFIITHGHDDRVGGIAPVLEHGIPVFATTHTQRIAADEGLPAPDNVLVEEPTTMAIGEITVETYFPGHAHAPDNIVVWFPEQQVLFGGCMIRELGAGLGNVADADVASWSGAMDNLLARYTSPAFVVPGHGAFGDEALLDHTAEQVRLALEP